MKPADKNGEASPLLGKKGGLDLGKTQQWLEERTWTGFGDADKLSYGEGETFKIKYPKGYNWLMRFLIVAHFITGIAYITWIGQDMKHNFGYFIGPSFLIAEVLSFITRCVCFTQYITKQRKAICPLHKLRPAFPESDLPVVQFCVTHYKEPVAETYHTIKKLCEMDYPMDKLEINVLDDGFYDLENETYSPCAIGTEMTSMLRALVTRISRGHGSPHQEFSYEAPNTRRPEAAAGSLVIEFKHEALPTVRHICRKRPKVSHFKGGNLNNAIFNVLDNDAYQFFAFLDCDMAPTSDFLQLSLPQFFKFANGRWIPSWEVAMTQAPQAFHNLIETNGDDDPLFQQTDVYWRRTMQHLDHWGLVHYYGTNVIMFKPALEDCVGWQYGVLSEDTPTGANLTSLGWQAMYVDQEIAHGLVKDTVVDTLSQRKRWAGGNVSWGILKLRSWLACFLTESFKNPPFYNEFLDREAKAKSGEPLPIPNRVASLEGSSKTGFGISPEDAIPESEEHSSMSSQVDIGYDARKIRANNFWFRRMWGLSYWHVTWSNPINGFWFIAYVLTAVYMLLQIFGNSEIVTLNVLYAATHFGVTTTILFVIGPQSTLWRGCQDRFAFAWCRIMATIDAIHKAVNDVTSAPWNSSAYMELMAPPVVIFVTIFAIWAFSMTDCLLDLQDCFDDIDSTSWVSAEIPTQVVGLFLGFVILVSMWPIFRCSMSDMLGFPMFKFRFLPGNAFTPYFLAVAPVVIFALLFFFLKSSSLSVSINSYSTQVCVREGQEDKLAPSIFLVGCHKCATTSMYQDMNNHFPSIDSGTILGGDEEEIAMKDKHYFDDDEAYSKGWSWYLGHYTNCSSSEDSGVIAADFTETYLESDSMTARRIYSAYIEFPESHGTMPFQRLKFVVLLRNPVDRLLSYYTSAKADNTLDLVGVENVDDDCLSDVANCDELTFDTWAYDQVKRASICEKARPHVNLWPSCGSTGLFGGLYSLQVEEYLTYFNASQIAIVPLEGYSHDGPQLLTNLAEWLDVDFVRMGMSSSSHVSATEYGTETMAGSTRNMLATFYEPYVSDLFDIISNTGVAFIDIIELKDLFRR